MYLIFDVGNTSVKTAVFKEDRLLFMERVALNEERYIRLKNKFPELKNILVSDVVGIDLQEMKKVFTSCSIYRVKEFSKLPFYVEYETPKTLGDDRIGLVAAAAKKYPNENVLVIDVGSCITYDFLSEENKYIGGAISPGIKMRYRSLHEFTGKLPLVEHTENFEWIGKNTLTSIQVGVYEGVVNEIEGQIEKFKSKYGYLTIILTGGDAKILEERLKNTIFAQSNFLIEGLYEIFKLNISKC